MLTLSRVGWLGPRCNWETRTEGAVQSITVALLMVNLTELIRIFLWFLPDTVCGHGVVLLCCCFFVVVCFPFVLLWFLQSVCKPFTCLDEETDQK